MEYRVGGLQTGGRYNFCLQKSRMRLAGFFIFELELTLCALYIIDMEPLVSTGYSIRFYSKKGLLYTVQMYNLRSAIPIYT